MNLQGALCWVAYVALVFLASIAWYRFWRRGWRDQESMDNRSYLRRKEIREEISGKGWIA